jgi:hypothetical protein
LTVGCAEVRIEPSLEAFMDRTSQLSRTPANLSDSVHHQLNLYALAATAAGVGILALTQPAEARIVYTPTHMKLQSGYTEIDLNHDGITDFALWIYRGHSTKIATSFLAVYPNAGNGAVGTAKGWFKSAVALWQGAKIGPHRLFNGGSKASFAGQMVNRVTKLGSQTSSYWEGQFADGGKGVKKRYLGFQFLIKGKIHYGWARIRVDITGKIFTVFLNGYAYETVPNKPIVAGATNGSDALVGEPVSLNAPATQTPTLGLLALGSPGLFIWRRE